MKIKLVSVNKLVFFTLFGKSYFVYLEGTLFVNTITKQILSYDYRQLFHRQAQVTQTKMLMRIKVKTRHQQMKTFSRSPKTTRHKIVQ